MPRLRGRIMYLTCYAPLKLNCYCACIVCYLCWLSCSKPKPPKRNKQERLLLKRMKSEQRRRDKNTKLWIAYVNESITHINRLLPLIQKRLIASVGYKLDLRSSIGLAKTDLVEMCAMQRAGAEALKDAKKGAVKDVGKSALKELMKTIKPKVKLETDFTLLKQGKSPIVDFEIDFQFAGVGGMVADGDDDDDEEDGAMSGGGLWELGSSAAYLTMARKLLLAKLKPQIASAAAKMGIDETVLASKDAEQQASVLLRPLLSV